MMGLKVDEVCWKGEVEEAIDEQKEDGERDGSSGLERSVDSLLQESDTQIKGIERIATLDTTETYPGVEVGMMKTKADSEDSFTTMVVRNDQSTIGSVRDHPPQIQVRKDSGKEEEAEVEKINWMDQLHRESRSPPCPCSQQPFLLHTFLLTFTTIHVLVLCPSPHRFFRPISSRPLSRCPAVPLSRCLPALSPLSCSPPRPPPVPHLLLLPSFSSPSAFTSTGLSP